MKNSLFWRIGTAVLVVGSILYTARSGRSAQGKRQENAESDTYEEDTVLPEYRRVFDQNLIIPDGWTFGVVWATIYAGTTALAIHQALPDEQDNPRYEKAWPWLGLSYVLNAAFGHFFSDPRTESQIASDVVTKLNLPVGLALHQQLGIGKTEVEGPEKYLRIPISLYAGWLTAASVVGTPNLLLNLKLWQPDPRRDVPLSIGILGVTTGLGYAVARRLNDPYYMLPFVAGLAGIATKQYGKQDAISVAAGAFSLTTAALFAAWIIKERKKAVPADEDEQYFIPATDTWEPYPDDEKRNEDWETYSYTSI